MSGTVLAIRHRPPAVGELLLAVAAEPALHSRIVGLFAGDAATLVGAVTDAEQLADVCGLRTPHVTIVDWEGCGSAGVRVATGALPGTRVVVVLRRNHPNDVRAALRAGADGVVLEASLATNLPIVVRSVSLGQASVPRERRMDLRDHALSPRERDVLTLVSQGLRNAEIAAELCLAQSTVKRHLSSAYAKLGVASRDEVLGLLDGGHLDAMHHNGHATNPGPNTRVLNGET
jgi:DNA-binding NarL/FixJ family response regulator